MGLFKRLWEKDDHFFSGYMLIVGVLFILWIFFFADDNIVRYIRGCFELHRQSVQIEQYQKEIAEMDKQIRELSTDRDTLEEFARERFHFAAPGEDVYLLEQ